MDKVLTDNEYAIRDAHTQMLVSTRRIIKASEDLKRDYDRLMQLLQRKAKQEQET